MKRLLLAMVLAAAQTSVLVPGAQAAQDGQISKRISKLLAQTDGATQATAFKVRSVAEEYKVLAALGLEPKSQALIMGKKTFDRLAAVDPKTGQQRTLWFDISSFYGAGF